MTTIDAALTALQRAGTDPTARALAIGDLLVLVEPEVRSRAHALLRGSSRALLQTTLLVNETYIKLLESRLSFSDLTAFRKGVAHLMRQVLIDLIRREKAAIRGGDLKRTALDFANAEAAAGQDPLTLILLNEALDLLPDDERNFFELLFFYGLSLREIGESLHLSYDQTRRMSSRIQRKLLERLKRPNPS